MEVTLEGTLGRRWTFGELLTDTERLARALFTRYPPGERIAVWAPNIPEWVILEYAAALAGLTLVTVNPAYRPRELRFVLEQSRSVGLFHVPNIAATRWPRSPPRSAASLPSCAKWST